MAPAHRPCPLCGADPEHQQHTHGLDEVQRAQLAVRAEIAKIALERSDLMKATTSRRAEQDGLARRAERMALDLQNADQRIADTRPLEAASRTKYEELSRARDQVRMGISLARRIDALKQRKSELDSFKATSIPKSEINVGIAEIGWLSATLCAMATAYSIAPMRTLPGFRAAVITPGRSALVRIRCCGLQP